MSVRENGEGGAWKINFENTVNEEKILDQAKSLLFVDENGANSGAVV